MTLWANPGIGAATTEAINGISLASQFSSSHCDPVPRPVVTSMCENDAAEWILGGDDDGVVCAGLVLALLVTVRR